VILTAGGKAGGGLLLPPPASAAPGVLDARPSGSLIGDEVLDVFPVRLLVVGKDNGLVVVVLRQFLRDGDLGGLDPVEERDEVWRRDGGPSPSSASIRTPCGSDPPEAGCESKFHRFLR
jgi:hypothetical protein